MATVTHIVMRALSGQVWAGYTYDSETLTVLSLVGSDQHGQRIHVEVENPISRDRRGVTVRSDGRKGEASVDVSDMDLKVEINPETGQPKLLGTLTVRGRV